MALIADVFFWLLANPGVIFVFFLLFLVVFIPLKFLRGPKPGPNPFKKDCTRPPKPLVEDQAARDKVLKQGFHPKRIPEDLDAIVIGSGIGGLSVAALLSKVGKKVLVLEQHDQAGGCCHTFIEKGFEFDVGIHYIGEMRSNTMSRILVSQLTEGQLVWNDLIDDFDVVALGEPGKQKFVPFVARGYDGFKTNLLKYFPKEEKAIDKFIKLLIANRKSTFGAITFKFIPKWLAKFVIKTGLYNMMTPYFKYSQMTVKQVMEDLTDDKDLRAVLSYSFGDYGTNPSSGSFAMHAMLLNHYIKGASYPRGGASEIGYHIIPVIERSGGKVLVRAPVSEILVDASGAVNGVRVKKTSGPVDIFAPIIISDAGVINTYKKLLPPQIADKSEISNLIRRKTVDSGIGAMSVFVGLNGEQEELGLKAQNIWAFTGNDLDKITSDYLALSADDVLDTDVPLLFISFPSTKDETYKTRFPGKSVCTVVTLARWEWFQQWKEGRVNKRGEDYNAIKNSLGRRIWEQVVAIYPQLEDKVVAIYPQLEDKVEFFEVGSPLTNQYYLRAPKGEIYGLDHDVRRFGPEAVATLRPETDIPGLMLTGQDVMTGGFMGACFGGFLCASQILKRNLMDDLMALKKVTTQAKKEN